MLTFYKVYVYFMVVSDKVDNAVLCIYVLMTFSLRSWLFLGYEFCLPIFKMLQIFSPYIKTFHM